MTPLEMVWLIPVLPLLGFVLNGAISLLTATTLGPADPSAGHGSRVTGHDEHSGHGSRVTMSTQRSTSTPGS